MARPTYTLIGSDSQSGGTMEITVNVPSSVPVLILDFACRDNTNGDRVIDTVDSDVDGALTQVYSVDDNDQVGAHQYRLANPTSGDHTFTVNWDGLVGFSSVIVGRLSGSGTIELIGSNTATGSGTAATVSYNPGEDALFLDNVSADNSGSITPDGSQTEIYSSTGVRKQGYSRKDVSTGSSAMSWTIPSGPWAMGVSAWRDNVANIELDQDGFRFYDDDGSESASTALAAEDTDISVDNTSSDVDVHLRLRLQEEGSTDGVSTDDYQLQFSEDAGEWRNLTDGAGGTMDSNIDAPIGLIPLYSGDVTRLAQSFTGSGKAIKSATIKLVKNGSPTGNYTVGIYAHSGTYGTSSVPTGSPLVSKTFAISGVSSISSADIEHTFDTPLTTVDGTKYEVYVEYTGGDASNSLRPYYMSGGHDGNYATYEGSWSANSSRDMYFSITEADDNVIYYGSANLTDGGATTERLASGTGSFIAGEVSEDGIVDNLEITADDYTELLYTVRVKSETPDTTTIDFRVLRNAEALDTYTVTPRVTVTQASGTAYEASEADAVDASDALTQAVTKAPADTPTVDDDLRADVAKVLDESPTITDAVATLINKNIGDGISVAVTVVATVGKGISDSVAVDDVIAKSMGHSIDETINAVEAIVRNITKVLTDGLDASDQLAKTAGKLATDSVDVADLNTQAVGKFIDDDATVSDSLDTAKIVNVTYEDNLTASDATAKQLGKNIADNAEVSDNIFSQVVISQSIDDDASASDTLAQAVGKGISDNIGIAETDAQAVGHAVSDSVDVDDTSTRASTKSLADSADVADVASKSVGKFIADGVDLTDSLIKTINNMLADGVTVASLIVNDNVLTKFITDDVTATDVTSKQVSKSIAEAVDSADALARVIDHVLSDDITVADTLIAVVPGVVIASPDSDLAQKNLSVELGQKNVGVELRHTNKATILKLRRR